MTLSLRHAIQLLRNTWNCSGFAATLTNDQLLALEACLGPNITYIEQDTMVRSHMHVAFPGAQ